MYDHSMFAKDGKSKNEKDNNDDNADATDDATMEAAMDAAMMVGGGDGDMQAAPEPLLSEEEWKKVYKKAKKKMIRKKKENKSAAKKLNMDYKTYLRTHGRKDEEEGLMVEKTYEEYLTKERKERQERQEEKREEKGEEKKRGEEKNVHVWKDTENYSVYVATDVSGDLDDDDDDAAVWNVGACGQNTT